MPTISLSSEIGINGFFFELWVPIEQNAPLLQLTHHHKKQTRRRRKEELAVTTNCIV